MPLTGVAFVLACSAVPFLAGLAITINGRLRLASARRWSSTTGCITGAVLARDESESFSFYVPTFTYAYRVGNRDLTGSRIRLMNPVRTMRHADATAMLERYAPGTTVTVYHDPAAPWDSCLEIDRQNVLGIVIMALAVPFWVLALFVPYLR